VNLDALLTWLQDTSIATAVRENEILFPWIESIHVLAFVVVVGSISIVDLRLLGLASRERPVSDLLRELLPITWGAFAIAATAGALLFSSKPLDYAHSGLFQAKMVLLALAGINMVVFHAFTGREVERWKASAPTPVAARTAGALSLILWIGVVTCGRWIGFTLK
jgi:hypothetical protein